MSDTATYATGARSQKSTGTKKFIITVGGAFLVIIVAVSWSVSNEINDTRLARPTSIDATPGGRIQAESELYQDRLLQYNESRADQATENGVTFVPTPDMILRPLGEDDLLYRPDIANEDAVEKAYELFYVDNRVVWEAKAPVVFDAPPSVAQLQQVVARGDVTVGRSAFGSGGQGTPPEGARPQGTRPQGAQTTNRNSAAAGQEKEPENPFIQAITRQMGAATETYAPGQSVIFGDIGQPEPVAVVPGEGGAPVPVDTAEVETPPVEVETIMHPGDILYGETLNYVTSDLATPVLVRLTTGPYAGARLTGAFQVDNASRKLFIGFTTITFEDGVTVPIQAFAVDGYTSASTVASDVDTRFMARYGAIMASAFVAGFAESAATAGESVVTSGDSTIVSGVAPTAEQSLFAGVAAAGTVIADDLASRAPKGPEIIIRSGYPVGILIVTPVTIETEAGAQVD